MRYRVLWKFDASLLCVYNLMTVKTLVSDEWIHLLFPLVKMLFNSSPVLSRIWNKTSLETEILRTLQISTNESAVFGIFKLVSILFLFYTNGSDTSRRLKHNVPQVPLFTSDQQRFTFSWTQNDENVRKTKDLCSVHCLCLNIYQRRFWGNLNKNEDSLKRQNYVIRYCLDHDDEAA